MTPTNNTNRWMTVVPESDVDLFDMLHALYGVGDYDETAMPWWKFRYIQAGKIKNLRKSRHISVEEFALAIRYCVRHRYGVGAAWQVCGHVPAAKAEVIQRAGLSAQVDEAVALERALPSPDSDTWLNRLLLTRGPYRKELLEKWKTHREGM